MGSKKVSPTQQPIWLFPDAPYGSAVRFVASLSPFFQGVEVGIPGRSKSQSSKTFLLGQKQGTILYSKMIFKKKSQTRLGKLEIWSQTGQSLDSDIRSLVDSVVETLGEL